jgi:hypothetical protein
MFLPTQIALVLIDEVHLLNENRGSSLEAGVISRIKMVSQLREMREVRRAACSYTQAGLQHHVSDSVSWLKLFLCLAGRGFEGLPSYSRRMQLRQHVVIAAMCPAQNPIANVRFVAVSATIPNIKDIGDWLGVPPQGIKVFGEPPSSSHATA